jgi:replication factor C small subunit
MEKLWVEKYRPKVVGDVIFQDENMATKFKTLIKSGQIPNLLFSGVQGSGKTTLSRVLIRELKIDPSDLLTINASDENSIDAMRDKIKGFAYTMPMGKFKVVQLEEFDYLTPNAQSVLRAIIEDTSAVTRFIATCNYENKIMPAIKSRFQQFNFKAPDQGAIFILMADILDKENIELDVDLLQDYVAATYPDIRKTINMLQQYSHNGKLQPIGGAGNTSADWKFKLIDLLKGTDFRAMRKLVCENCSREEYEDVFRFLYENISKSTKFKDPSKEEEAICIIADHLYRHSLVADPEINIASMFIALGNA